MEEINKVCCMCGDVGFADKLFRCCRCFSRVQHSYCSSFYEEGSSECAELCDWCRSEERSAARHQSSKKPPAGKERDATRGKSRLPARPPVRRYKLLKDVIC
ncbi:unnamed protein product [Spirodela intermedia]|uniref:PHD-type zinc finger plants domain-containing protein n=2 Tax=Spirodela intermedia TaxID=51605 RepID=A0A7I8J1L6_SPIIN|nr:unnamed protein product [Spirodela intermedia]CAA6663291.1 unnamed protein product [Spirodela intermedia]CAA7399741.1 unnamed protein product [Spirodela intermedia]